MRITHLVLAFSIFLPFLSGCQNTNTEGKGKILVKVDNAALTEEGIKAELSLASEDSISPQVRAEYLNRWIDNQLLYDEAKRRGLEKNPEVKMRMKQAAKDITVLSLLNDQIIRNVQVSEAEARKFYEQNQDLFKRDQDELRASHILFSTQVGADSAYTRLKKGEDFARLAEALSLDSQTKNSGGDIGFFNLSTMHPVIAKVAFGLKTGEVSAPFKTEMGYHILKVTDRKPTGSVRDFEEIKVRITGQLLQEKRNQTISNLLAELKKKAKIERFGWAADSQIAR